jgi:hypothetical protein
MKMMARIKEKLKRFSLKKIFPKNKKTPSGTSPSKAGAQDLPSSHQFAAEQAKFSYPQDWGGYRQTSRDLPSGYGTDKIVLCVRDPWWLYTYWEVINATWDRLKRELGDDFYKAKKILRVYDVSHIIFNGTNAHRYFDIELGLDSVNWYIDTAGPGRSWCVDLGLRLADGRFITIVRSNTVSTPLDGPSWITDEEWMIPDDMFARLYGMGFGFGKSSPVGKGWQERFKHVLSSGVSSVTSILKK